MKKYKTAMFLVLMILSLSTFGQTQQTTGNRPLLRLPIPETQLPFISFYVNDDKQVFLPVGGGIYLPNDSIWFIPPSKKYYFTSVAPNPSDTAFFVIGNTATTSELFYIRASARKSPIRFPVQTLDKGAYNLIFKNNLCCIWGYSSGKSRIGVLANKQVKWLFTLNGVITQVQLNDAGEIFFASDNSIYQLTTEKKILTYEGRIFGFDFDEKQQIVLSCEQGICYVDKSNKLISIANQVYGFVIVRNNSTFVLPTKGRFMYRID